MDRRALLAVTAAGLGLITSRTGAQSNTVALLSTLKGLELKSWDNAMRADVAAMERYFVDDAILIMSDGSKYTKKEYIASTKVTTTSALTAGEMTLLQMSPDVASVLYTVQYTSSTNGGPKSVRKSQAVGTYVQRNGAWFQVLYQETPVK